MRAIPVMVAAMAMRTCGALAGARRHRLGQVRLDVNTHHFGAMHQLVCQFRFTAMSWAIEIISSSLDHLSNMMNLIDP